MRCRPNKLSRVNIQLIFTCVQFWKNKKSLLMFWSENCWDLEIHTIRNIQITFIAMMLLIVRHVAINRLPGNVQRPVNLYLSLTLETTTEVEVLVDLTNPSYQNWSPGEGSYSYTVYHGILCRQCDNFCLKIAKIFIYFNLKRIQNIPYSVLWYWTVGQRWGEGGAEILEIFCRKIIFIFILTTDIVHWINIINKIVQIPVDSRCRSEMIKVRKYYVVPTFSVALQS